MAVVGRIAVVERLAAAKTGEGNTAGSIAGDRHKDSYCDIEVELVLVEPHCYFALAPSLSSAL